jgi:methionyl-tRNA formyltransferase
MKMAKGLDTGDIILQKKLPLEPHETVGSLHDKLAILGGKMIVEYVNKALHGNITLSPQEDAISSYAAKIDNQTRKIYFDRPAEQVMWHIHGLSPFPGAMCRVESDGRQLKLYECRLTSVPTKETKPGTVLLQDKQILIACQDVFLSVLSLQEQGGKRMDAFPYINGRKIANGDVLIP